MDGRSFRIRNNGRAACAPAFLPRFITVLLAALLLFTSAFAEDVGLSWEERVAAAREKYNAKTVNVFRRGNGAYRRGKINACFYPSKNKPYINISIRESLQITDEAEMEAVLEVIAASRYYNEDDYGTLDFMRAQWVAHNFAYELATGGREDRILAALIAGESVSGVVSRSSELDISPYGNIPWRDQMIYNLISFVFSLRD